MSKEVEDCINDSLGEYGAYEYHQAGKQVGWEMMTSVISPNLEDGVVQDGEDYIDCTIVSIDKSKKNAKLRQINSIYKTIDRLQSIVNDLEKYPKDWDKS